MIGMTKLVWLMTLTLVSFLPQNGVDALNCFVMVPGGGKAIELPCPGSRFCLKNAKNGAKTCSLGNEHFIQKKDEDRCGDLEIGKICVCDKDLCNSTSRLHGHCVFTIFLAIVHILKS